MDDTLTRSSGVFHANRELVAQMADAAGLKLYVCDAKLTPEHYEVCGQRSMIEHSGYAMWMDRETYGGGCRLVWKDNTVWVSSHAGYPHADITEEVCDLFRSAGCKEEAIDFLARNPYIYPEYR